MFTIYVDAIKSHYADFSGRLSRRGYWLFVAANLIINFGLILLSNLILKTPILYSIYSVIVLIPSLAAAVRRLHDTNKSGWFYLLVLTGVGAIVIIVFLLTAGDDGDNRYGSKPEDADLVTSAKPKPVAEGNKEDDAETVLVSVEEDDDDLTEAVDDVEDSEPEPEAYLIRLPDYIRIDMHGWSFSIGKSSAKADYVVSTEKTVSRRHATISVTNNDFFITDDSSMNGTFVNNIKLIPGQEFALHDGDLIRLSNVEFIFHIV